MNDTVTALIRSGGPFLGLMRAQSRVTVQPDFWLNTSSGPVGNYPTTKLPVRWWQIEDNSQVEVEIPNVKSVQINRDLTQQAATVAIQIYNNLIQTGVAQPLSTTLGTPGFFSWSYGSTSEAEARWNQTPTPWSNVLRENALIRVYQGYGGFNSDGSLMSIPDAVNAGYLILKGVFLLDDPAIEAQTGIITLNGRDMAKLLIDQQTVPPLIPASKYPLNYWGPGQATNTITNPAVLGYGINSWTQVRAVYDSDSGNNAVGGKLAFDGNRNTVYLTELKSVPSDQVWIQMDCQEEVTGVYVDPQWGNYVCYASVFSNGAWLGSGNVGGIPFVAEFGIGIERPGWHPFPKRYMATKVRLTFTNLWPYDGQYLAGIREIQLGLVGQISTRDKVVLDLSVTPSGKGYRIFGSDGGVYDYGDATYHGDLAGKALNAGIVGGDTTSTNKGYWLAGADGGIFQFGDAAFHGSLGSIHLNQPVVSFQATPSGGGYWMAAADGGVFNFGNAGFYGSLGSTPLSAPVSDFAARPQADGYWMVAEDGGVFEFGHAGYHGNGTGILIPGHIFVGIETTSTGNGYWLVDDFGNVYGFGDAVNYGGVGSFTLNAPISGIRRSPTHNGYYLIAQDGGVFDFGGCPFFGALPGAFSYTYALPADYKDYADIITDLALWSGFYLYPSGASHTVSNPAVGTDWTWTVPSTMNLESVTATLTTAGAPLAADIRVPTLQFVNGSTVVASSTQPSWEFSGTVITFTWDLSAATQTLAGNATATIPSNTLSAGWHVRTSTARLQSGDQWSDITIRQAGSVPAGQTPPVLGIIETTGAYDTLGPLGIQFFDKRPVIDVMTDIANLVGYLVRVDDTGGLRFESPNIWAVGNFLDDGSPTSVIPTVDERISLNDYVMTQSDQDLRSPIIVAVADPYEYGGPIKGTNVTTFIPPYANLLRGITKSAMYAVPLQVDAKDQEYFAELIAIRIWFQTRTGAITAWADPTIEVDDQIRIYERTTGETNVHYVQAIQSNWDDTGKFENQYTTYWLGGHDVGWAITSDLSSFFGVTNSVPVTTSGTLPVLNQGFPISNQLALFLGASGAKSTQVFSVGASNFGG